MARMDGALELERGQGAGRSPRGKEERCVGRICMSNRPGRHGWPPTRHHCRLLWPVSACHIKAKKNTLAGTHSSGALAAPKPWGREGRGPLLPAELQRFRAGRLAKGEVRHFGTIQRPCGQSCSLCCRPPAWGVNAGVARS